MSDENRKKNSDRSAESRQLLGIDPSTVKRKKQYLLKLVRRKFTWLAVLVLVLVGSYALYITTKNTGLAARVGNTEIKKTEVERVVTDSQGEVDYKAALDLIIETEQYVQFAASEDLQLSEDELNAVITERLTPQRANVFETNKYSYYVVLNAGLKDKLAKETSGTASGVLYQFDGSRLYPNEFQEPLPGTGDEGAIQEALAYAKTKAEEYHQKVTNRSITAETAIEELRADPKLKGSDNGNISTIFTENDFEFRQFGVGRDEIRTAILRHGTSGLTDVTEVKLPHGSGTAAYYAGQELEGKDAEQVPHYYFFVDIHTIRTERGLTWLEDGLKKIQVKRYE